MNVLRVDMANYGGHRCMYASLISKASYSGTVVFTVTMGRYLHMIDQTFKKLLLMGVVDVHDFFSQVI